MVAVRQFDSLPPQGHFPAIVDGLHQRGWVVIPDFLDASWYLPLLERATQLRGCYTRAAIGRGSDLHQNQFVRTDHITWLDTGNAQDGLWLGLMEQLRQAINSRLFLGLFEHEAHYAWYEPDNYYKRHLDAFRGEGNRVVSVVLYLNPDWQAGDGGEFVIYPDDPEQGIGFLPRAGTLAVFLSEEFPHEVLPAERNRYSLAGWFRLNGTQGDRLDPPA